MPVRTFLVLSLKTHIQQSNIFTGTPHNHRTIADTTVRITVIGTSHFAVLRPFFKTDDIFFPTPRIRYYADYYTQAVRNVDKMKYSQDMNQLESANAPPKDVRGLVGSTKGAVGPSFHVRVFFCR